ncbi:MAG TPA: mechanosensitive ion channel domain-containing protein [Gemmata sp.]
MVRPLSFSPLLAVWRDVLPGWMSHTAALGVPLADWVGIAALAAVAALIGAVGQALVVRASRAVIRRTGTTWDDRLAAALPGPLAVLLGLLAFALSAPALQLAPAADFGAEIVVRTLLIASGTVMVVRLLGLASEALEVYLSRGVEDENRRRSIRTQVAVPRGILRVLIVVLGVALVLLQFDVVRSVGLSLLASAGLAGIIIGLAAQKAVGNLLAGVQLAVFQPVRIGDAVVVEGEWGWIEEIGLTHVVVKVWDLRRLVLPVGHFLDKPFQNWTRGESNLLGTVMVFTDYTVSVTLIRDELGKILAGTPLWDGRAQGVQVTNLTESGVEIRVLVSAADGAQLWDLRCLVRERLLSWLQTGGRAHLPVTRVDLRPPGALPAGLE